MPTRVFLLKPLDKARVWLRRYVSESTCTIPPGYHDYLVHIGDHDYPYSTFEGNYKLHDEFESKLKPPNDDTRWPTHCGCGYKFEDNDVHQLFIWQLYEGAPDGNLYTLRDAPVGALWYATWYQYKDENGNVRYHSEWNNMEGPPLICKLPGGHEWNIDSRASNCDMPDEKTHRCWVRHGEPPNIHVDKNGHTCNAGAGSIALPHWHGFLHNGELTP